jgi:hypothetical protein
MTQEEEIAQLKKQLSELLDHNQLVISQAAIVIK